MRARNFGLILIGLVILPLSVAGTIMIQRARGTALDAVRTGNQRIAVRAAARLGSYVDSEVATLRTVSAALAPAVAASPKQAERVAKNYLIVFPHLRSLDVVGKNCQEIATARLDGLVKTRCGEPAVDHALAGKLYRSDVTL